MGVVDCDSMLMLLGIGESMSPEEKEVMTTLMMKGFKGMSVVLSDLPNNGEYANYEVCRVRDGGRNQHYRWTNVRLHCSFLMSCSHVVCAV